MSLGLIAPPMHSRCGESRRQACSSLGSSRRWLLWRVDCIVSDIRLGEEAGEEVIIALYGTRSSWSYLVSSCIANYIGCFTGWCPNNFHDIFYILFYHRIINGVCIYIYSNFLVGDSFLSGSYTRSRWRFNASALKQVLIYHRLGRRWWLVKVTGCYLSRDSRQGPRTEESFWSYLIELAPINVAW